MSIFFICNKVSFSGIRIDPVYSFFTVAVPGKSEVARKENYKVHVLKCLMGSFVLGKKVLKRNGMIGTFLSIGRRLCAAVSISRRGTFIAEHIQCSIVFLKTSNLKTLYLTDMKCRYTFRPPV